MTRLSTALDIPRGITALVGGGGKTSLINRLAAELCENSRVLRLTTTRIYPPTRGVTLLSPSVERLKNVFSNTRLVTVGEMREDGKLRAPDANILALAAVADYTLIEADGSRGLPMKTTNDREPVLTGLERLVIALAGATGFYRPISEAAHRPELYSALVGKPQDAPIVPSDAAAALEKAYGSLICPPCRFNVVINQCDDDALTNAARACARALSCKCALVSLEKRPDWRELYQSGERLV